MPSNDVGVHGFGAVGLDAFVFEHGNGGLFGLGIDEVIKQWIKEFGWHK